MELIESERGRPKRAFENYVYVRHVKAFYFLCGLLCFEVLNHLSLYMHICIYAWKIIILYVVYYF